MLFIIVKCFGKCNFFITNRIIKFQTSEQYIVYNKLYTMPTDHTRKYSCLIIEIM
jgi:hypothetical protein